MSRPLVFRVRQRFERPRLDDIPGEVSRQLASLDLGSQITPGSRIAVTVGSRGIAHIARIAGAAVDHLKALGLSPFIVPAMGSHGGATAEGQRKVLAGYGVTEEAMGCPILSSMETVIVCQTDEGFPVHFDRHAYEADGVLVIGRVKPHTMFVGDIESGLMKMMLIGLGKHAGAEIYHRAILNYSFGQIVRSVAKEVIERCRIIGGLGIVENAFDETAEIAGVRPQEFVTREPELLRRAKELLPRLPFKTADVLVVDRIGKEISGTGMDTNIIGRKFNDHEPRPDEWPKIKRIIVRSLTQATAGNACGIGLAELAHEKAVQAMDIAKTRVNCITANHLTAGMIPFCYPSDAECLDVALSTIGLTEPPDAQLMWMTDTLHLEYVECSTAYLEEAQQREDLEILTPPRPLPLDEHGQLSRLAME
jgi:hypothetical protein